MTDLHTQEPTRLLDDPDLEPGLRHDLELAHGHAPVAYSVDAGLARFEQTLHGVSTVPPGGSVSGLRVLGWFVGAVALLGGVGYLMAPSPDPTSAPIAAAQDGDGTGRAARAEPPPVIVAPSSGVHTQPSDKPEQASVVDAQAVQGAQTEPIEPVAATAKPIPKSVSNMKPEPEPAPAVSLAEEAAQINAARKALASDPAEALALMESAEQAFPDGAMVQERRGYTILALVALGRTSDASEQADAYLERWPNGPLSRRVRDALGR